MTSFTIVPVTDPTVPAYVRQAARRGDWQYVAHLPGCWQFIRADEVAAILNVTLPSVEE